MAETFLELARREFGRLKELADRAMAQITDDQFFAEPGPVDNSVAVILKHLSGNARSRWRDFLTADGEKPDRHRDSEFEIAGEDSRERLLKAWEEGWALLFAAITPLTPADLDRPVTIRGESLTVLQAVSRQLTHYAYHVGQIVYVCRHFAGDGWVSLSIPKGESAAFNRKPTKYV